MGLLDGKVALVTGSTRGIGRAMAVRFGAEGARVVVNGRREDDAAAAAATIPGAWGIGADMADLGAVAAAVERITGEWGGIDILVNNAAISGRSAITRVLDEDWERMLQVNLTGPMYVTRAVVPAMKQRGSGVILNVISGSGTAGTVGFSSYAASKGGLVGLTMTLAKELAGFGIRVNALAPSALTDMLRQLPPQVLEPMIPDLPTVEAVADSALFLVSDLSRAVTGQIISATAGSRGAPHG
jgi:3-oxoacyl-[acyl-carrier protein] reductase